MPSSTVHEVAALNLRWGAASEEDLAVAPAGAWPVLYSFRRCPYAMRARLALLACGITVELREIVLRDKPQHLRVLSPKATVPVLWLPNGDVIDQSLDIMRWAIQQADPCGLRVVEVVQQAQLTDWLAQLDGPFKHHLDRYKYPNRYEGSEDLLVHRASCVALLGEWAQALSNSSRQTLWLGGDHFGFADLALLPFVRQFRIADPVWFDTNPNLEVIQGWLNRFIQLPLFEAAMKKHQPWVPNQPVVFLSP